MEEKWEMNVIITNSELKKLLEDQGYEKICLADDTYALPTEQSVKDFGERYFRFLVSNGLAEWIAGVWDCDDFSLLAKALANIDNAIWKKRMGNDSASLAFGIAWVMGDKGGHSITVSVSRNDANEFILCYYEPQIQKQENGESLICFKKIPSEDILFPLWCYF